MRRWMMTPLSDYWSRSRLPSMPTGDAQWALSRSPPVATHSHSTACHASRAYCCFLSSSSVRVLYSASIVSGLPPLAPPAPEPATPDAAEEIPYLCADDARTARFRDAVSQAYADVEVWAGAAVADPAAETDGLCASVIPPRRILLQTNWRPRNSHDVPARDVPSSMRR